MSTSLILFVSVAAFFLSSTIWCCLAISSAAEVEYDEPVQKPLGDYWCMHRNGEFYVVVAYIREEWFCWSYRQGQEHLVGNVLAMWYRSGLLKFEEATAIYEMVNRGSLVKEVV